MDSSEAKNHNCVQYLKDINNKLKQDLEKANKREAEHEQLIRDLQILLSTQSDEINELKQKINSQSSISSGISSNNKFIFRVYFLFVNKSLFIFTIIRPCFNLWRNRKSYIRFKIRNRYEKKLNNQ
jgi:hypothetical protein